MTELVDTVEPPPGDAMGYDDYDGPLCVCGHYLFDHHPRGRCYGQVGDDDCTCLGHRESKRARR